MSNVNLMSDAARVAKAMATADAQRAAQLRKEQVRALPHRALCGGTGEDLLRHLILNTAQSEQFLGDVKLRFKGTTSIFNAERVTACIDRDSGLISLVSACGQTVQLRAYMHKKRTVGLVIEKLPVYGAGSRVTRRASAIHGTKLA